MFVKVWKKLLRIQRRFIWGGAKVNSKISWVKWYTVCKSNMNGDLGVRDLDWRRSFIVYEESMMLNFSRSRRSFNLVRRMVGVYGDTLETNYSRWRLLIKSKLALALHWRMLYLGRIYYFPLSGIVELPLKWWNFLGNSCKIEFLLRKTFSRVRSLSTRRISLVYFAGLD